MTPTENEQSKQPDGYTPAGRDALYQVWIANQSRRNPGFSVHVESAQRRVLFERWLRDLLQRGDLDPLRPLPSHAFLAEPFHIHTDQVARVIRRLRKERLLPAKQLRMNAGEPVWTKRDLSVLEWIADQRAVRYDQLRRLLARESGGEPKDPDLLSMSRTAETIKRWVKKEYVIYRPILAKQPGWIWLTRKGLQTFSEEGYRPGSPAPGTLAHLYWMNQVRLYLEERNSDECEVSWTSERWLQHQHDQMKQKDIRQDHMPDGIVEMQRGEQTIAFEVEVELSRKSDAYLQHLMRGYVHGFSTEPLCYYVGEAAETTVLTALKKLQTTECYRPWIEVYQLPHFKLLAKFDRGRGLLSILSQQTS